MPTESYEDRFDRIRREQIARARKILDDIGSVLAPEVGMGAPAWDDVWDIVTVLERAGLVRRIR